MSAPLRVALIGFGVAGSFFHAPLIEATPGLRLDAIVTTDPERRQQATARYPRASLLSLEELWTRSGEFDVAVVAAPNRFHLPLALEALKHRLHVVVDKPVGPSLAQARLLVPAAREADRVVSVFHNRRWDGDFLTLQDILQEGVLGPIIRFESRFDRWRPRPRPGSWRESQSHRDGGGLLLDLGSHLVDQAVCLFGRPQRIYAEVNCRRAGVEGDDDFFLALQFPGEVRAHLGASCLARAEMPRFLLQGMEGSYQKFAMDPQEEALRAGRSPLEPGFGAEEPGRWGNLATIESRPRETRGGDYRAYYEGLERSLRGDGPPPVTLDEALVVMEILDGARRSADLGTVIDFCFPASPVGVPENPGCCGKGSPP